MQKTNPGHEPGNYMKIIKIRNFDVQINFLIAGLLGFLGGNYFIFSYQFNEGNLYIYLRSLILFGGIFYLLIRGFLDRNKNLSPTIANVTTEIVIYYFLGFFGMVFILILEIILLVVFFFYKGIDFLVSFSDTNSTMIPFWHLLGAGVLGSLSSWIKLKNKKIPFRSFGILLISIFPLPIILSLIKGEVIFYHLLSSILFMLGYFWVVIGKNKFEESESPFIMVWTSFGLLSLISIILLGLIPPKGYSPLSWELVFTLITVCSVIFGKKLADAYDSSSMKETSRIVKEIKELRKKQGNDS
jgi:hypothetical protein